MFLRVDDRLEETELGDMCWLVLSQTLDKLYLPHSLGRPSHLPQRPRLPDVRNSHHWCGGDRDAKNLSVEVLT